MLRSIAASLGTLLTTAALSHSLTDEWSAAFTDRSCYVARSAGPVNLGGASNIEFNATFYTPRRMKEMRLPHMPETIARPVVLQIQIVQPFPSWYALTKEWFVSVLNDGSPTPLARDTTIGSDVVPGFSLGGEPAAKAWEELRKGRGLQLEFQYGQDQKAEIHVESGQIDVAAAMLKACLDASRREDGQ